MGSQTFSYTSYVSAKQSRGITSDAHVTRSTERTVFSSGRLMQSVDPAMGGVVRRSLMRFNARDDGMWTVTVGCPIHIESLCDTTGSMGTNVDTAMKVLPDTYACAAEMLPGYDPQLALGIFGDFEDKFILQRPQFEMEAQKIVDYLADMAPERRGAGNHGEDPEYGLFAAAYLTDAYDNRIGLKGYHFCITDEPVHDRFDVDNLKRVFGEHVFRHLKDNGHEMSERDIYALKTQDVVRDLLRQSHAFVLLLKSFYNDTVPQWQSIYGAERVIQIPDTRYLPQIQGAIIGLTEGTLGRFDVYGWLCRHGVPHAAAKSLDQELQHIPMGAQAALRARLPHPVPKAGDVFAAKTDLWPIDAGDAQPQQSEGDFWL